MIRFSTLRQSLLSLGLLILSAALLPPAARATALVQTKSGQVGVSVAASATLSLAFTSTVASGDTVAVAFGFAPNGGAGTLSLTSITDDKGNTYTVDQNNLDPFSGSNIVTAHAVGVTNAPQTISIVVGSSSTNTIAISATVYELSSATTVDVNAASSSSANPWVVSFSTAAANEVAIISDGVSNSAVTFTQNNGWTQDETSSGTATFQFHNTLSSAGSNSINATPSTAVHNAWAILSFKGAPSAPFAPISLNSGSNALNLGTGPNTGTGDPVRTGMQKIVQDLSDLNTMVAQLYPNRSTQTPATGFTITAAAGITQLVLTPAGTLASGTITLPPNPGDNQPFMAMTSQTITALTVNTSDGTTIPAAPTTLSNTSAIKLIFQAASNSWIREQ